MPVHVNARPLIVLGLICVSLISAVQTGNAQNQTSPHESAGTADTASPNTLRPFHTEPIDQAGRKISKRIEQVAAKRLGGWITHEAFANISWLRLILCLFLVLMVVVIERIMRWAIQHKIDRVAPRAGTISWGSLFLRAMARPLSLFVWIYGLYTALSPLYGIFQAPDGSNLVLLIVKRSADIGGTVALFWFFYQLVGVLDARLIQWAAGSENTIDDMLLHLVGKTLRIFIVVIGGIMVLQNLTGMQIGPLIASLGIGGLAVALAAKDSIANFFGTLTILFDKPFQVGERIIIDDYDGTVENVGFRSTRIRLLNGHLVTIPNEKVVNSALENIGRRPNIRWLTNIGITYDTPPQKVAQAVEILKSILDSHEGIQSDLPPRVHFNGFNDWSLNITVIAWYHPPDYWNFQAWVQETCLEIMRRFEAANIDFAFPSRTLYLANEDKRQLKLQLLKGQPTQDGLQ